MWVIARLTFKQIHEPRDTSRYQHLADAWEDYKILPAINFAIKLCNIIHESPIYIVVDYVCRTIILNKQDAFLFYNYNNELS